MNKGLPAKILLIPGVIIFSVLVYFFISRGNLIPDNSEYQKDQTFLLSAMKTKLPETPFSKIKYPVQGYRIPGLGGYCWLESSSGLIRYLEPDIDFDAFLLYARPTLMMAGRDKNERWGPGLNQIHAFTELGYTAFRGATNPVNLPQSVFPDIDPRHFIYFKTSEEEWYFMKKLISVKIIPTIIYDGDFSTVIGYDQNGIWIVRSNLLQTDKPGSNFLTLPVAFNPVFKTYDEFFDNWELDHQFFWFEKRGTRKPESEIYAENKLNAQETPQNLEKIIKFLKEGGDLLDFTAIDIPGPVVLYRYFLQRGNAELANDYLEIAKIYDTQRASQGAGVHLKTNEFFIKNLETALPLYEKIATEWP